METLRARGDLVDRRNPLYLLSAAAMAVGARLYLVTPDAPAGEIGLILLTLGVLQLYEIAASAVLLTLHRFRRSPEDLPSLLLVAGLFWTGPLAATVEMTRHGSVGLGFFGGGGDRRALRNGGDPARAGPAIQPLGAGAGGRFPSC
jgi:hypothetical protein